MKALTVHQPYASLIAVGVKQYETRSWSTKHRGELAIHAGKRWTRDDEAFTQELISAHPHILNMIPWVSGDGFPLGEVLCIAQLVDVIRVDWEFIDGIGEIEYRLGYFAPGRFAWKLEIVRVFSYEERTSVRGKQGLWEWNP